MLLTQGSSLFSYFYDLSEEANISVFLSAENNLDFTQNHLTSDIHLICPGIAIPFRNKAWGSNVIPFVLTRPAAAY